MKRVGELVRLRASVRVTVPLILFGLAAIFSAAYAYQPEWRDNLKFMGAAFGVAAAIQSVYFAQRSLQATVEDRQLNAACEYFQRWYGPDSKDLRDKWRVIAGQIEGKSAAQITEIVAGNADNRVIVGELLNFFEELGYAVRRERIELEMMRDLMGTVLKGTYRRLQPWLVEYRRLNSQPTAWEHFEWLNW